MTFSDILLLFIVGGLLGFIIETIYCYLLKGTLERRSGVIYSPFNPVYALGAVLMTTLLGPLGEWNLFALFVGSAVLGGLFEAACSLFQEKVYGTVSWDYSGRRFSFLGGRTSLIYMIFWGILGTVYVGAIHPFLFSLFGKIPAAIKIPVVAVLMLFLLYDLWLSSAAVQRWRGRLSGKCAVGRSDTWLDTHFPNERMLLLYPSMTTADKGQKKKLPQGC